MSICPSCRIRRRDDLELCGTCETWRATLESSLSIPVTVEFIRTVMPVWLMDRPKQCVRVANLAAYYGITLDEVLRQCTALKLPVVGLNCDPPIPMIAQKHVPAVVASITKMTACSIPDCARHKSPSADLPLCATHRQFLTNFFQEQGKEINLAAFRVLEHLDWITIEHACQLLDVGRHVVSRLLRTGKLCGELHAGKYRISTAEAWRFIGLVIDELPQHQAREYLTMSKMQLAHFLNCPTCNVETTVGTLTGNRVLKRSQLRLLKQKAEMHRKHNQSAHDWSTRIKPGELSAEMLEERLGINFNNRRWLIEHNLLEFESRPPSLQIYTETQVAAFLDRVRNNEDTQNWPRGLRERILSRTSRQTT